MTNATRYRPKPIVLLIGILIAPIVSADAEEPGNSLRYQQHALTHSGDARRGRELFFHEKLTKCSVCHKINASGRETGPDLSVIGGKFDRPHLIESLLEPSRQIVEGFRTTVCVLNNGRIVSGVVKDRTEISISLIDVDGKIQILPLAEIDERRESDISLMPDGLEKQLTPEQFTDLIAFLETCRNGKGTPGSQIAGGITLPDGFRIETVATGLTGCTAIEATPDGRVLICEQTGTLRVVKGGELLAKPALTLPVEAYWERGLIGVTIAPDFPRTPYIYVCYVAKQPYPHHRVSRFTMKHDVADSASERLLLEGDDQRELGGKVPAGHQGGVALRPRWQAVYRHRRTNGGRTVAASRYVSRQAVANQCGRLATRRQPVLRRSFGQVPSNLGSRSTQSVHVCLSPVRRSDVHQ